MSQEYQNLEILVIDDGSTDGSQDIIKQYSKKDSRIRYWLMEHPEGRRWGQGHLNFAFKQCTGEFFSVLDSDDLYEPDFWETVLNYFTKPEIGFVRIGMWMFGEDIPTKWLRPKAWQHVADIIAENKVFISSPFRMEMQRQVGDWDDNISWSDWDFWARCVLNYGWAYTTCNEPMFRYRRHGAQLAYSSAREKNAELVEYMTNKYQNYFKDLPVVNRFGRRIGNENSSRSIVASTY